MPATPAITLSHIGLHCFDLAKMVDFYTGGTGLTETDRGEIPFQGATIEIVFPSGEPRDHHQIALVGRLARTVPLDGLLLNQISSRLDGPPTLRKAKAEAAPAGVDQFLPISSFALTAHRIDIFRTACHEAGRPFEPDEVAVARTLHIVRNTAEREAAARPAIAAFARLNAVSLSPAARGGAVDLTARLSPPGNGDVRSDAEAAAILSSPDECIERLRRLQEIGAGRLLLIDFAQSPETLVTFADEIMPAFQRSARATRVRSPALAAPPPPCRTRLPRQGEHPRGTAPATTPCAAGRHASPPRRPARPPLAPSPRTT